MGSIIIPFSDMEYEALRYLITWPRSHLKTLELTLITKHTKQKLTAGSSFTGKIPLVLKKVYIFTSEDPPIMNITDGVN